MICNFSILDVFMIRKKFCFKIQIINFHRHYQFLFKMKVPNKYLFNERSQTNYNFILPKKKQFYLIKVLNRTIIVSAK